MQTINIGIVAHVDAGKTSLTERLLFDTGVIDHLGSVDAGTTQTDTGEIERRRGITIRSAVAAFTLAGRQVNLIDTPGHSDFVAEVERALGVLDGAVLVLSAVEGVQPHTRVLMRTLRSLRLPTLIFVNKIDRSGARGPELVADIGRLLTTAVTPMNAVERVGTAAATVTACDPAGWGPVLADRDDSLLAALVDDVTPGAAWLTTALRTQLAAGDVCPLLFGSALTGAGVADLLEAVGTLLPASPPAEVGLRGQVFAITRGPGEGDKVAYVRSYGGELRTRQRVTVHRRDPDGRFDTYRGQVTAVRVAGRAAGTPLTAGLIAEVRGLPTVRIGDQIGSPAGLDGQAHFPRPSLETVVRPRDPRRSDALHTALVQLADTDPLIRTRVSGSGDISIQLYGEVQKEVIAATLAERYGIDAVFAPSQITYLERPVGVGAAVEIIGNGFLGTVGLRVQPGTGVSYRLEVELGSLPLSFHKAIEDAVRQALAQGIYGWPVTGITVTLTHSGYWSPVSTAGDFRDLAPQVLALALAAAGTRVHEPCHRFELDLPADRLGVVVGHLAHAGARVDATTDLGRVWRVTGEIPARAVHPVQRQLPHLSGGEAPWSSVPEGDRAVMGRPPRRPRTDGNPGDRAEYTRFLSQRHLATTGTRTVRN